MKTLLFEGAGMEYTDEESNIGNYRIRTAFINNEGKQIYLEMGRSPVYEASGKSKKMKIISEWGTCISHLFYITGDTKDCNINKIYYSHEELRNNFKYNKEDVIKIINKLCNTSFETLEVLDHMEGYGVHKDNEGYNLMDNHIINRKRTIARTKAFNDIDMDYRRKLNEKYSKISLMEMNDTNIVIKCYASIQSMSNAGLNERCKTIMVTY
ncbi:hypothetical protein [Clostridium tagluense]|uniref:Uncharacterized protein n=1 Tax=Clostridium tagluense TaxID=360422 RepID=A0A401USX0_9CLOT|nr:hypothetical protein [Clostridium tagluense]GCD12601.1 hypothetical protein Ctaglu_42240 [Clostridium tagluense]